MCSVLPQQFQRWRSPFVRTCNRPSLGEQALAQRSLECYRVSTSTIFLAVSRLTDYCRKMARQTSSNTDEEDLAPALLAFMLSQLLSDAFGERADRLYYYTRFASASSATGPSAPPGDEENNLALASRISQWSFDATEGQGQSVASNQSARSSSNAAHQTAPQYEFDDINRAHIVRATS